MIDIHRKLAEQIAKTRFENWKKQRWMCAELVELQPAYKDLLPDHKVFEDLGSRALTQTLRHGQATFDEVWQIIESADMSMDELTNFVVQVETNADLNLHTGTWKDFAVERRAVSECEWCALGTRLVALSAVVLAVPLPIEVCREIAHTKKGMATYEALQKSLEALCPPTI